jgi:hypothetical protein
LTVRESSKEFATKCLPASAFSVNSSRDSVKSAWQFPPQRNCHDALTLDRVQQADAAR